MRGAGGVVIELGGGVIRIRILISTPTFDFLPRSVVRALWKCQVCLSVSETLNRVIVREESLALITSIPVVLVSN